MDPTCLLPARDRLCGVLAWFALGLSTLGLAAATPPNVVIIFTDDLGYGDLGCYGHPTIRTPAIDRMAREGLRFTSFYAAAPICTASRTALLTGRYAVRSGMGGGRRGVLFPDSMGGLPPSELTLAELLQARGYATAMVGKWHLGIHPGSRPNDCGFESSLTLPYSNDMDRRPDIDHAAAMTEDPPADGWNVPLLRDGGIVERPVDQTTLTRRLTAEAVAFIEQPRDRPMFLYFAHPFPHVPLFASPGFRGRSDRGRYGDTVEEIDWSVREVLAALQRAGQAENTLVVFSSDNGPWLTQGLQGGSSGPLRDGKGGTWEGGLRVPGILWWPGRIAPGVTAASANTMDVFATVVGLAGADLPSDRIIDGADLAPLLLRGETPPERPFFYYRGNELAACRLGRWKAHYSTRNGYAPARAVTHDPPLLFDLERDPGETTDLAAGHPDVLRRIAAAVTAHRATVVPVPSQLD